MTKKKTEGSKFLSVRVPLSAHDMLKKLAIDSGLSITEIIMQYIRFLRKKHWKHRSLLLENQAQASKFRLTPKGWASIENVDDDEADGEDSQGKEEEEDLSENEAEYDPSY